MGRVVRLAVPLCALVIGTGAGSAAARGGPAAGPALTTLYPVKHPHGVMATSGGWAYCEQLRRLARVTGYALLCGTYDQDGYRGPGLRSLRHLDWGNLRYLTDLARKVRSAHRRFGGKLILIGVSYSGFGVATLASHHPELRPSRLIVLDSFLDLPARRAKLPSSHETAKEIDDETGGSQAALRRRSVRVAGLARLVHDGTRLTVIWSVSEAERRFFNGATCDRTANAGTLAALARRLRRPVSARVTQRRHGGDLWRYGARIVRGWTPGRLVVFRPDGLIPAASVCPG
jgi:pimeloyl-ACP methyl ester carboxylesterase